MDLVDSSGQVAGHQHPAGHAVGDGPMQLGIQGRRILPGPAQLGQVGKLHAARSRHRHDIAKRGRATRLADHINRPAKHPPTRIGGARWRVGAHPCDLIKVARLGTSQQLDAITSARTPSETTPVDRACPAGGEGGIIDIEATELGRVQDHPRKASTRVLSSFSALSAGLPEVRKSAHNLSKSSWLTLLELAPAN